MLVSVSESAVRSVGVEGLKHSDRMWKVDTWAPVDLSVINSTVSYIGKFYKKADF